MGGGFLFRDHDKGEAGQQQEEPRHRAMHSLGQPLVDCHGEKARDYGDGAVQAEEEGGPQSVPKYLSHRKSCQSARE